jgi:hypothetical protein
MRRSIERPLMNLGSWFVEPDHVAGRHDLSVPDVDGDIRSPVAFAEEGLAGLKPDFPVGRLVVRGGATAQDRGDHRKR